MVALVTRVPPPPSPPSPAADDPYLSLPPPAPSCQLLVRHVEDSLALLAAADADLQAQPLAPPAAAAGAATSPLRRAGRTLVADIGSGSGFPGMVVAIARPEWDVVLVEAVKKARCLLLCARVSVEVGSACRC